MVLIKGVGAPKCILIHPAIVAFEHTLAKGAAAEVTGGAASNRCREQHRQDDPMLMAPVAQNAPHRNSNGSPGRKNIGTMPISTKMIANSNA